MVEFMGVLVVAILLVAFFMNREGKISWKHEFKSTNTGTTGDSSTTDDRLVDDEDLDGANNDSNLV